MGAGLSLLEGMPRLAIQPDIVTFNSSISACEKQGNGIMLWFVACNVHA